ncbi:MAG: lasso peptide biosynthesis B2 protein [Pseudomonadota bacterium]
MNGQTTDRRIGLEAVLELCRARVLTLLPPRIYTRALGQPSSGMPDTSPADLQQVRRFASTVERVAERMPFRAQCLQQVIATRRMLRRRGLGATIYLGVAREGDLSAHAWIMVGDEVISGDTSVDGFAVIGTFA